MSTTPANYWLLIRQRFLKNKRAKWSVRALLFFIFIAIFGDFIAGEVPIYCQYKHQHYFPVLKKQAVNLGLIHWTPPFQNVVWRELDYQKVIYPLIPYAPSTMDKRNRHYKSPFAKQETDTWKERHWLGTDDLGRDTATGLLNGLRIALVVGVLSMLLASLIGIFLGGIAGYFGDDTAELSIGRLGLNMLALFFGIYFGFIARQYALSEGNFIFEISKSLFLLSTLLFLANWSSEWLEQVSFLSKRIKLSIDLVIMRIVEVISAIPGLLLILALAAIIKRPTILTLIFIIGIIGWTNIARFIRAELLKIRNIEYIQASRAMGFSHWRILFLHALPNALGPVLIVIAFGVANAILAEATLSFLGVGVPNSQVTWGTLLAKARNAPNAWWLAFFPGLAIFSMVLIFNLIGEGLKEAIDSKE